MFEKIKSKLLIFMVPTIIIIIALNYFFSVHVASNIISTEIDNKLISIKNTKNAKVEKTFDDITTNTKDLAIIIEETYSKTTVETYKIILKTMVEHNPNMLGLGIWFEPNSYAKDVEYEGIYAVSIEGEIKTDDVYILDNYDYLNRAFYTNAVESKKTIFTDPMYDETIGKNVLVCATPMFTTDGSSLGVVTALIDLSYLPIIIENYNTEDNKLYIINEDGIFIAHDEFGYIENNKNILQLENQEIVEVGELALSTDEGITSFTEQGKVYRVYYNTISNLGWKLMYVVSEESVTQPLKKINHYFLLIGVIALFLSVVILRIIVKKNIEDPVSKLVDEIEQIACNSFETQVSEDILHQNDEFGKLGKTLETMKVQLKQYQKDLESSLEENMNNAVALELQNKVLENKVNEVEYLSYHDQLTGLNNRRHFEKQLGELSNKKYFPVHAIVSDVNSLKIVNDSFGHDKGDEMLLEYVDVLRKSNIDLSLVSRTGGDEFIIIIPNSSSDDVDSYLESLITECKTRSINGLTLSVSFGLAVLDDEEKSIYEVLQLAEDRMIQNKLYDAPGRRDKTIQLINSTLQEKNPREQLHSERVALYCEALAKEYGLPTSQQEIIRNAGLLHDIGKIGIPEELLNNSGKLTNDEFSVISKHPEIGYRILTSAGNMNDISIMVLSHHERCDGTGYPRKLTADEIPLGAKIIAIADSFDAMTSDRSYRKGLPKEVAIEELLSCRGTQFDAELVDIFVNKVLQI